MTIKTATGFPTSLYIGIQPVIVQELKFSFTLILKREFSSVSLWANDFIKEK
jgi:hypothetical protein